MLEPSELNDRARFMLQRAGLNTDGPISIEKATAAFDQMRNQGGGGGRFNRGGEGSPGNVANSGDASRENKEEDNTPPLVPPFGESVDAPSVPGFGEDLVLATASFTGDSQVATASSGGASSSSTSAPAGGSSSSASSSSGATDDAKIRGYAASMMKQYDKNGDGVLEKEEWSQMSNGERYDRNHDGKVTLDEIVETLKNWNHDDSASMASRSDSSGSSGAGASRTSSSGSTATADAAGGNPGGSRGLGGRRDNGPGPSSGSTATGKHYLTPKERLPEGLPDWFAQDDADGDGQVSMHEFASTWTESKLAEFAKYDLNGDGFITPDEVLKVSPPKK
ncbi:MAG TPA: hypothetical protein VMJ32_03720 [Pirellulales bacterium]|nr:hypothetical protein [Pirellulales bacterium]